MKDKRRPGRIIYQFSAQPSVCEQKQIWLQAIVDHGHVDALHPLHHQNGDINTILGVSMTPKLSKRGRHSNKCLLSPLPFVLLSLRSIQLLPPNLNPPFHLLSRKPFEVRGEREGESGRGREREGSRIIPNCTSYPRHTYSRIQAGPQWRSWDQQSSSVMCASGQA